MIFEALLWSMSQAASLLEGAVDVFVPDEWLAAVRNAMHGTGVPLVQAALYWFPPDVVAAIAVTIELVISLFLARVAIRAVRRIRSWLP